MDQQRLSAAEQTEPLATEASAAPALAGFGPRWAVIGIFLMLSVAGFAYARDFLMPTVLGFLLALVFSPVRRALERLGLGSGAAAFVITGTLLMAFGLAMLALAGPAQEWVSDAQAIGREIEWKLRDLRGLASQVQDAASRLDELATAGAAEEAERVVVAGPGFGASIAGIAPAMLAQVLFTVLLMFFLLASGDMIYEKIVHAMPRFGDKKRSMRIARDIERKLSRYLFTITLINACLGVAIGIGMWWLGMPNPVLLGVLGFLLNYIPYVGALAGVAMAGLVGLVSLPTASDAFIAAGVYLALTSIEGQIITPIFVGRNLQLNTVVVFLSVTFWAWLWSGVGMLVATPLLVTIRVFCDHVPALENFGIFLSARGSEKGGGDEYDEADRDQDQD